MTAQQAQALRPGALVVSREPDCYPGSRGRVVKAITFPDHRFGFPSGVAVEIALRSLVASEPNFNIFIDAGKCEAL